MPEFTVSVKYSFRKPITIRARDEVEAEEKACDIVSGWNGVIDAEAEEGKTEET